MKRVICAILAVVMLLALVACSSGTKTTSAASTSAAAASTSAPAASAAQSASASSAASTSQGSGELTTLVYGAPSTATSVTIWYALQQGYFKQYGVDLQITFFNSGTSLNDAARAGEVDLYSLGSMMSTTGATTFGSKLLCYLAPDNASYHVVARSDSAIVKAGKGQLADYPDVYADADAWKGSTVLWTRGQSGHYTINALLELMGLTDQDITAIDLEQNQIPAAFEAGQGDVMVVGNPLWADFEADSSKYTKVASLDMLYPAYDNIATIMACPDALENKTDALKGFAKAVMRAQNEFAADNDLFEKWMYEWQSQYNVDVTKESAAFDCQFYKMPTLEWDRQYFEGGDNSICAQGFMKIAAFMNSVDNMSDDVYKNYNAGDHIASDIILSALDELDAEVK
jgi:ABC-type nitrate/sulfonate/bicarbonate transport system substrate-binding protein